MWQSRNFFGALLLLAMTASPAWAQFDGDGAALLEGYQSAMDGSRADR